MHKPAAVKQKQVVLPDEDESSHDSDTSSGKGSPPYSSSAAAPKTRAVDVEPVIEIVEAYLASRLRGFKPSEILRLTAREQLYASEEKTKEFLRLWKENCREVLCSANLREALRHDVWKRAHLVSLAEFVLVHSKPNCAATIIGNKDIARLAGGSPTDLKSGGSFKNKKATYDRTWRSSLIVKADLYRPPSFSALMQLMTVEASKNKSTTDSPDPDMQVEETIDDEDFVKDLPPNLRFFYTYVLLDEKTWNKDEVQACFPDNQFALFVKACFYVGKGSGSRLESYASRYKDKTTHAKVPALRRIWDMKGEYLPLRCLRKLTEEEALTLESLQIRFLEKKKGGLNRDDLSFCNISRSTLRHCPEVKSWSNGDILRAGELVLREVFKVALKAIGVAP